MSSIYRASFMHSTYFKKVSLLLSFSFSIIISSGQISPTDIQEFGRLANIHRKFYEGANAMDFQVMLNAFPEHSPIEIKADIEQLGTSKLIFDKFCYSVVLINNGNRQYSGEMLNAICTNATLSLRIVDYIKEKFKAQLAPLIAERQLKQKKAEELQKAEELRINTEREQARKDEEVRKAKEQDLAIKKEAERKIITHEIKLKNYNLNDYQNDYIEFGRLLKKRMLDNIYGYSLNKARSPFPSFEEVSKLEAKNWSLSNSYELHAKMINQDTADDGFTKISTVGTWKLLNGSDSAVRLMCSSPDLPLLSYQRNDISTMVMSEVTIGSTLTLFKSICKITTDGYKAEFTKNKPDDPAIQKLITTEFFKKMTRFVPGDKKTFTATYELFFLNGEMHFIQLQLTSSNGVLDSFKNIL